MGNSKRSKLNKMQKTLGGDRLGSGKKQKIHMRDYERSTHDLGYIWRSTMASGTLVPFMAEVALPGDSMTIDLDANILTHPTIGPLFGSYKVQLDVFTVPVRLYQGKLHMNMIGVGMEMAKIKLPELKLTAQSVNTTKGDLDNQQINPSSLLSYLNIRGLGTGVNGGLINRRFNAISMLAYWDIYKNYYANKQEEIGACIHNDLTNTSFDTILEGKVTTGSNEWVLTNSQNPVTLIDYVIQENTLFNIKFTGLTQLDVNTVYIYLHTRFVRATELFRQVAIEGQNVKFSDPLQNWWGGTAHGGYFYVDQSAYGALNTAPKVTTFPLKNIDTMRAKILEGVGSAAAVTITDFALPPYTWINGGTILSDGAQWYKQSGQELLALKTYQSDLFNNWISTEWLDGDNGVNSITAVAIEDGRFTIDSLNLSRKIYDMLNRIALSGGSYDDWLDATYTHERTKGIENPMYIGGLSKELVFQEVISNASSPEEPLGTLAGRGKLTDKHKGGHITVRTDEPSYIIGLVSLTPRIDYSQGNKWDVNLKTMDDFHKPALDEIGFEDLITDQMAWWDTKIDDNDKVIFKSAGKQPAWINYTTNVNQIRGNFASESEQMFMTLTRRYDFENDEITGVQIKDLTTYIDPSKFNHIFADTRLDAQNFWVQIKVNNTARRKMSARVIPNL